MLPAVDKLERAYRDLVQPRMCGLPVYNTALKVEAVGFEPFNGCICGVLVTPWCMNLVLLPGMDDDWSGMATGKNVKVTFPAGVYRFTQSAPVGIDAHLSLPLFTTLLEISDQDTARAVASEVLRLLYLETGELAQTDPVEAESDNHVLRKALSRRELLRGRCPAEGGT